MIFVKFIDENNEEHEVETFLSKEELSSIQDSGDLPNALYDTATSLAKLRCEIVAMANGLSNGWSHTDVASAILQLAEQLPGKENE